ncbi:unnamed protein product [Mytilus edulis]|uniref:DDE Tnp4 domain-containing protein n=1 Tax=Mytilus edulis TaxID=6550 RepID=A0A8S3Q1L5_MYTED|nr:unnamed protein product [Mytilus edulis]
MLQKLDRRTRVYRCVNERFVSSCVHEVDSFDGGSFKLWAAISNDEKTELLHVLGNLTAKRYRDKILYPHLMHVLDRQSELFQQDNARPHTVLLTIDYLEQNTYNVLPWPSKSPDLNHIEYLWDQLDKHTYGEFVSIGYTLQPNCTCPLLTLIRSVETKSTSTSSSLILQKTPSVTVPTSTYQSAGQQLETDLPYYSISSALRMRSHASPFPGCSSFCMESFCYVESGFLGHQNDPHQYRMMRQIGANAPLNFPEECVLLGDKIYHNRHPVITPFTRQQITRKPDHQKRKSRKFNRVIAEYIIIVEHAMGDLKNYKVMGTKLRLIVETCAGFVRRQTLLEKLNLCVKSC